MPPQPNNKKFISNPIAAGRKAGRGRIILFLVLLVWAVLLALIILERQALSDWWRLRGYQPPSSIARLASQDTMNGYTKHLFYLNKPQLLSSVSSFREHCPENEDTIVLGCYHPGEQGIYIYNVQDPSLQGVAQVTAAHEVLHAIYGRLSAKDRTYVDGLLTNYYQHGLTNARVKSEIQLYQKTEPHDVTDEMHSTFGTEIADLPPALENYYKRYFNNRQAIVNYEQQYEAAFTSRQTTIQNDDQQLSSLKQQIADKESSLTNQLNQLKTARSQLDSLLAAGDSSAYNSQVATYNSQVNAYNAGVADLQTQISRYNQLVTARNLVAGELTTLDKAVDTRLAPQSAQ
ncbi:MAG TPA: hypothetical protein VHC21_03915 [Candidatus Saccharimonadales bacterium]|nr:hypothetical protein [Candidatus Saccharimonadales bacterium]